jgi:hypothetical protein
MIMNKIGVKEDEIKYFITDSIVVMILDFLHKMSPYICKTYLNFQFILTYLFQRRLSKRKSTTEKRIGAANRRFKAADTRTGLRMVYLQRTSR